MSLLQLIIVILLAVTFVAMLMESETLTYCEHGKYNHGCGNDNPYDTKH